MTVIIGRSLTKGEVLYTVEDLDGGLVQGIVRISCDGSPKTFKGEPVEGKTPAHKKQAEKHAAESALAAYKDTLEEKLPEHDARKEAIRAERQAIRDEKLQREGRSNEARPTTLAGVPPGNVALAVKVAEPPSKKAKKALEAFGAAMKAKKG